MRKKNTTILIVDDEPKIDEVVSTFLTNQGFEVISAENGALVLRHCLSRKISR